MAIKKTPFNKLKKSAKYYRSNPKAAKKKAATDKKINARPEQLKKRRQLGKARRKLRKTGVNIKGKDLSHTKKGLVLKPLSINRGSTKDSAGDRRARGKKKPIMKYTKKKKR